MPANKIYPMRLTKEDRDLLDRLKGRYMMSPPALIMGVMRQVFESSQAVLDSGGIIRKGELPRVTVHYEVIES